MSSMTALLTESVEATRSLSSTSLDTSWAVPAGDVEWSCRDTAAHIADDLFSYASQVIAQPVDGFLPIEAVVDPGASNAQLLDAISMCGQLLRNAVESAAPTDRAWHPCGVSDPDGFAAMGAVEVLVHTHDIARGLSLEWQPPSDLCAPLLGRLFPKAPVGDPAQVLLYCCGRAPLRDLPRLVTWGWDSTVRRPA